MVKADPKHDYYADLEVSPSADNETIKKQFRSLAKQYHPDRNPGKETEVTSKFQSIQNAHEAIGTPEQREKYDTERAKYLRKTNSDPYAFKRSNTTRAPASTPPVPPPPARPRNPSVDSSNYTNARPPPSSGSAEKFSAFARAAPQQQWDRARYDDAQARAEALKNFQSMRGQPQPPPRTGRAPTAPKSAGTDSAHSFGPSPGFPGLGRTNSTRKYGFSPGTPGNDEPAAPPKSAFAYVNSNRNKPPPTTGYAYPPPPPPPSNPTSPPIQRARTSGSPLRQTKSSGFEDIQRPGFGRSSSRYGGIGGEKTNINTNLNGLGRSASQRNSPIDRQWNESGAFGTRSHSNSDFKAPPPRHHSSSPKDKKSGQRFEYSATETSSSDDEPAKPNERPKAVPRSRPRPATTTSRPPSNDAAFMGHFPNTNYTRVVDQDQYQYPPPESRDGHYRKPFEDMPANVNDITDGMNDTGIGYVPAQHGEPAKRISPPFVHPWNSIPKLESRKISPMINGIPIWAVPASVYPKMCPLVPISKYPRTQTERSRSPKNTHANVPLVSHANTSLSQPSPKPNGQSYEQTPNAPRPSSTFSASDWHGSFTNGDNIFRPNERDRKSPTKSSRKPASRTRPQTVGSGTDDSETDVSPSVPSARSTDYAPSKATHTAFQKGTLPEGWADNFSAQNRPPSPVRRGSLQHSMSQDGQNTQQGQRRASLAPPASPRMVPQDQENQRAPSNSASRRASLRPEDAMDIDSSGVPARATTPPPNASSRGPNDLHRSTSSPPPNRRDPSPGLAVDLDDLRNTAPLKPSAKGLDSLSDLQSDLPFTSRPADNIRLHRGSGNTLKSLNLPKRPKPILPPPEEALDQDSWSKYSDSICTYMHEWNVFNCKMIDHFRIRQEQVNLSMYHNWVTAEGDGASADSFDGLDIVSPSRTPGKVRAGYATYMEWLDQDVLCRRWWDEAFNEHRQCLEGLGRVRSMVKAIRARENRA